MGRKRIYRVAVRFDEDELEYFHYLVEKTGLSQEAYLRQVAMGKTPRLREERELDRDILAQLYRIGNNLNQIARYAHVKNVLNVEAYNEAITEFRSVMEQFLARE